MNKIDYFSHNWLALSINNRIVDTNRAIFKGRVVDLGCGACQYKKDILQLAAEYIGVDWAPAQEKETGPDIITDLTQPLPFGDGEFDTAVSFQVMEHLSEPSLFLGECFRILKSNGTLLITVPFMWHIHDAPHDYYRYTSYGLKYLLEKHGFAEIIVQPTTGFWQMLVLKFNYYTYRIGRGPLKFLWSPIWFLGQIIAPILDRIDSHNSETASYWLRAKKP